MIAVAVIFRVLVKGSAARTTEEPEDSKLLHEMDSTRNRMLGGLLAILIGSTLFTVGIHGVFNGKIDWSNLAETTWSDFDFGAESADALATSVAAMALVAALSIALAASSPPAPDASERELVLSRHWVETASSCSLGSAAVSVVIALAQLPSAKTSPLIKLTLFAFAALSATISLAVRTWAETDKIARLTRLRKRQQYESAVAPLRQIVQQRPISRRSILTRYLAFSAGFPLFGALAGALLVVLHEGTWDAIQWSHFVGGSAAMIAMTGLFVAYLTHLHIMRWKALVMHDRGDYVTWAGLSVSLWLSLSLSFAQLAASTTGNTKFAIYAASLWLCVMVLPPIALWVSKRRGGGIGLFALHRLYISCEMSKPDMPKI